MAVSLRLKARIDYEVLVASTADRVVPFRVFDRSCYYSISTCDDMMLFISCNAIKRYHIRLYQ